MYSETKYLERLPYPITFLKQVLLDIINNSEEIHIRFRLVGDTWEPGFLKVVAVTDHDVLVVEENARTFTTIDLNDVMQFELDERLNGLEASFHYDVSPASFL